MTAAQFDGLTAAISALKAELYCLFETDTDVQIFTFFLFDSFPLFFFMIKQIITRMNLNPLVPRQYSSLSFLTKVQLLSAWREDPFRRSTKED